MSNVEIGILRQRPSVVHHTQTHLDGVIFENKVHVVYVCLCVCVPNDYTVFNNGKPHGYLIINVWDPQNTGQCYL